MRNYASFLQETLAPHTFAFAAQAWICNLINAEVDKRERCCHERNAQSWRDEPPPGSQEQGIVILRPVQYCTPTYVGRLAQAKKLQAHCCGDGIDNSAHHTYSDNRDLVRQYLKENNTQGKLAGCARRFYEIAVTQGHRLRPQYTCIKRPARNHEHDRDRRQTLKGQQRSQDESQRKAGDQQKDVDDE